jgi:plastocyanin domain-containing protein
MKNLKTFSQLALGAALLAAPLALPNAVARTNPQKVTVTISASGFSPATVKVKAGREVHLLFKSKEASCANGFSIPALKRTISLQPGQRKEVVFTPKKGQTIAFACSMNMFKGKITAK